MNNMQAKLNATLNQWKRILNKEMNISADLRNQEKTNQAFKMVIKLEGMIVEAGQ